MRWRRSLARSATVSSKYEPVSRVHRRVAGVGVGEVEVLDLGRGEEGVALVAGPLERAAQHVAGAALERGAVEVDDVAEDPGHLGLGPSVGPVPVPGQELEGLGVGPGQDVALLDPAEAVDGRPVEGHPLVEGVLELGRGDAEGLGVPSTSVNHSWTNRMPRSSTVRSTYSSWLLIGSGTSGHRWSRVSRVPGRCRSLSQAGGDPVDGPGGPTGPDPRPALCGTAGAAPGRRPRADLGGWPPVAVAALPLSRRGVAADRLDHEAVTT